MHSEINTLKDLKDSGYVSLDIKDEMIKNLKNNLSNGVSTFEGIYGYDDSVIPDLERAILSKHNINLLGLRGQAKTRLARQLTNLLDEWIPIVKGSEINDDPFNPISHFAKNKILELGDATPIDWVSRNDRFFEKLATPEVTVADLIGDIDPIKEAILRKATTPELKEIAAKEGFRSMQDMGRDMILSGDLNFREYDRVLSME